MAELQLEAVLEFLRRNGFSVCESALMEDIMEKSQVGSSDFEKLYFPMVPPLPPLRIPATRRRPPPTHFIDDCGGSSSDDEFVSLGSSTTELCSSDFTNPYGVRTTRPTSEASSDRLSQFVTARDYPDFDMQNDLFWYNEKDEDFSMPPLFDGRDFNCDSSEDKYITSVQTGEPLEDQPRYNLLSERHTNHMEKQWVSDKKYEDDYSCLAPLCACCNGLAVVHAGDPEYYILENLKITDIFDHELVPLGEKHTTSLANFSNQRNYKKDWVGGLSNSNDVNNVMRDRQPNENDNYSFVDDELVAGEPHEPEAALDEEGGAFSDELLVYDKEDDYEIFNLRIVHRKNRTGFEENKEFPIALNSIIAG